MLDIIRFDIIISNTPPPFFFEKMPEENVNILSLIYQVVVVVIGGGTSQRIYYIFLVRNEQAKNRCNIQYFIITILYPGAAFIQMDSIFSLCINYKSFLRIHQIYTYIYYSDSIQKLRIICPVYKFRIFLIKKRSGPVSFVAFCCFFFLFNFLEHILSTYI